MSKIKKIKSTCGYKKKTKDHNKIKHYAKYKGKIALICPECFATYMLYVNRKIKASINVKDDNYLNIYLGFGAFCDKCGFSGSFIEVDGNLGTTIEILNRKGYYTNFCCEGHKKNKKHSTIAQAYIYFKQDLKYFYTIKEYLPKTWYIDNNDFEQSKLIIRSKKGVSLKQRMKDIQKMARDLPTEPSKKEEYFRVLE